MGAVPIYDGQFQISIEGGIRYRLPHGFTLGRKGNVILDAGQIRRPVVSHAGHGNAFRTSIGNATIGNRVHRSWVATFRRVCHFVISLLRRPGTLIVPSAREVGRHGKTVSMVKAMSPGSIRQSASAYEINDAISEIAKSGLVLMGFHLDGRGPAKTVRIAVTAHPQDGRLKGLRRRSAVNFDCPRTDVQLMGSRRHQWTSI